MSTTVYTIAEGAEGTRQTLDMMAKLAREGSRCEAIQDCVDALFDVKRDYIGSVLNDLDTTIRMIFRYEPEEVETIKTPEVMLFEVNTRGYCTGDCDDVATLTAAFLVALNVPTRLVAIKGERNNPEFTHVYTECECAWYWKRFDATTVRGTIHKDFGKMIVNVNP